MGGFGADGTGTLAIELRDRLHPPDEDVTRSYARWRVGTRMYAASSVPILTGHGLDSYEGAVVDYMRANAMKSAPNMTSALNANM